MEGQTQTQANIRMIMQIDGMTREEFRADIKDVLRELLEEAKNIDRQLNTQEAMAVLGLKGHTAFRRFLTRNQISAVKTVGNVKYYSEQKLLNPNK